MEPLHTPPEASSFVLLADHQARTPASFHSGPPVLHYHSKQNKLVIFELDLVSVPALNAIRGAAATTNGSSDDGDGEGKEIVIDGVDVWVTSDKFLLYAPSTSAGLSISYPSISLHAIQRLQLPSAPSEEEVQGLYMQIANPNPAGTTRDDDEEESIIMTIVPAPTSTPGAEDQTQTTPEEADAEPASESATQMLYAAVSACSNLHPDPVLPGDEEVGYDDDEGEGEGEEDQAVLQTGLPPPVAGSSGWITAENMHEFFDEEGNWIAGGEEPTLPLGSGAGTVRQREGEDDHIEGENEGQDDEAKWRRTD